MILMLFDNSNSRYEYYNATVVDKIYIEEYEYEASKLDTDGDVYYETEIMPEQFILKVRGNNKLDEVECSHFTYNNVGFGSSVKMYKKIGKLSGIVWYVGVVEN